MSELIKLLKIIYSQKLGNFAISILYIVFCLVTFQIYPSIQGAVNTSESSLSLYHTSTPGPGTTAVSGCSVDAVMESLNSLAVNSLIPHAFNPQQVLSATRHSFVQDGGKECCREKRTIWRADRKKEGGQFSWGKSRERNFKTSSVQ